MRVSIVTTHHVSYNPRVLKEADALAEAGHAVTVVTVCNNAAMAELDAGLMQHRAWALRTVNCRRRGAGAGESCLWLWQALRQRLCQRLCGRLWYPWLVERAQGRETPELRRLACSTPADLYIAHHAEALPAAAAAARRHGARLAFDAEDFHSGMDNRPVPEQVWHSATGLPEAVAAILEWHATLPKTPEQRRIECLESTYLPQCSCITAASAGIALAYERRYGLAKRPTTILNVFPLEESAERGGRSAARQSEVGGQGATVTPSHRHTVTGVPTSPPTTAHSPLPTDAWRTARLAPLRLYWYSQVIGPGRGLEEAVAALALLPSHVELHLRGAMLPGFASALQNRARQAGVDSRLHLHPPCPPEELIARAAEYDVGLALETACEANRLICVTNKIFTYMNAGLAVVASDTPSQAAIMADASDAGALSRVGDPHSLAQAIKRMVDTPETLSMARAASSQLAKSRYQWDLEKRQLLGLVNALSSEPRV